MVDVKSLDQIRFDDKGLVPAIVQDVRTGKVLMLGYMNRESLVKTLETGLTWFYSRSRGRLWQKGETSGHVQRVERVLADCDGDTLLVRAVQEGPGACHEGYESCFHYPVADEDAGGELQDAGFDRTFDPDEVYGRGSSHRATTPEASASEASVSEASASLTSASEASASDVLDELYGVVLSRKAKPVKGSYTSYLFSEGLDKILKKVGEESTEVLIAGKGGDREGLVAESADLLYHLVVLFAQAGVDPGAVLAELGKRRGGGGSEDAPPGK